MTETKADGFWAVPPSGQGPGVLVLHAWWGLNDTIKTFCKRLAENGFLVYAPDLYHGKLADTIEGAETLGKALDSRYLEAEAEVAQAAKQLAERAGNSDGIAVVGFSLGAFYALTLSAAQPELVRAVVLFYGTGDSNLANARAAFLGHFGDSDPYEPRENVDALEQALRGYGRAVTFYHYPAGHWFFEPDRADAYNAQAAALAWERTLAFLQESSKAG